MTKVDFKKERREYFGAKKQFTEVKFPAFNYLMFDGRGNPNTSKSFSQGVESLYGTAYTLKFTEGKTSDRDFVVPPLEALWWSDDWSDFTAGRKDNWHFTLMLMVPDWVTKSMVKKVLQILVEKKSLDATPEVRLEKFSEGRAVQVLHVGPYDKEGPILKKLHSEYLPENGLAPTGKHHEIYLSDMRRTSPEKLRTILRQAVKPLN